MKDTLIQASMPLVQQCLDILKRDDIKTEIKSAFKPVIDIVLYQINPYIYLTISLIFLIFIMFLSILIILILLMRNKNNLITFFKND